MNRPIGSTSEPVAAPLLAPPRGLVARALEVAGEEFAVLEWTTAPARLPALSEAEGAVAALLLEGRSNAEIAAARRRSVHTIANQVASVFRKLGVASRTELFAWAACGWADPPTRVP